MKMQIDKKGYFFVLDAALGLGIIVIGFFLVRSSYIGMPQSSQVSFLSDDLLGYLSKTRIKDTNNAYVGIGGTLWNQGDITNSDNTLLEQAGEFYSKNNLTLAEKFLSNVTYDIIPPSYLYEIWINGNIIYPLNPSASHMKSRNTTSILLTSKTVAFGLKGVTGLWGPYKAEVFVWEK